MIKPGSGREKQLGDGFFTARLAVPILAGLHAPENECREAVRAGVTTYRTPQNQQPQQTLAKTSAFGFMNITLVTTGTPGHFWGLKKAVSY
jgi:hypothetical protein